MGKSSGSSQRPNPAAQASAQTATNVDTAIAQQELANITDINPFGRTDWNRTGEYTFTDTNGKEVTVPNYQRTTTFSAPQQAIFDQQQAAQLNLSQLANTKSAQLQGLMANPVNSNGLPGRSMVGDIQGPQFEKIGNTDYSADRQRVEDALMARMQPSLDQDQERLETRLASQGIRVGSAAFDDAMRTHSQRTNDARMSAILGAGQEQSRLAGLELQRAQQANSAEMNQFNAALGQSQAMDGQRSTALQEQLALRNQQINEGTSLATGQQVSTPQFAQVPRAQIANTDFLGAQANADAIAQQRASSNQAAQSANLGGLMSLGAAAMMAFSDRRLKTDVKRIGKTDGGQNIYRYRYKAGGPWQIGLMAQEVEKKKPKAVAECHGMKMVNYKEAVG